MEKIIDLKATQGGGIYEQIQNNKEKHLETFKQLF